LKQEKFAKAREIIFFGQVLHYWPSIPFPQKH